MYARYSGTFKNFWQSRFQAPGSKVIGRFHLIVIVMNNSAKIVVTLLEMTMLQGLLLLGFRI